LRPDLAPAARVSADDILASLTAGPLADPTAVAESEADGKGEVVAFPPTEISEPEVAVPANRNWWRAANQWGGISAIVATAATLAVIALPVLQMGGDEEKSPAGAMAPMADEARSEAPPIAATAGEDRKRAAASEVVGQARGPDVDLARGRESAAAPPPPAVAAKSSLDAIPESELDAVADLGEWEAAEDYLEMGGAEEMDEAAMIIPEAQAPARQYAGEPAAYDLDDLSDLPEAGNEALLEGKESRSPRKKQQREDKGGKMDQGIDLTTLRAQGDPGGIGTAWRNDVDAGTLDKLDIAIASAETEARGGNYREAGDILAAYITAPASMGHAQAIAAANYYLRANFPAGAQSAASRGLSLSMDDTAARALLEVLYGDALKETGEYAAAEAAYKRAVKINASR
jgi:hypothetical protein